MIGTSMVSKTRSSISRPYRMGDAPSRSTRPASASPRPRSACTPRSGPPTPRSLRSPWRPASPVSRCIATSPTSTPSSEPAWHIGPRGTRAPTRLPGARSRVSTSGPHARSGSSTAGTGTTPTSSTRSIGTRPRCPCPRCDQGRPGTRPWRTPWWPGTLTASPPVTDEYSESWPATWCDFWTWHSLVIQQGLEDREAVTIAVRLLTAVAAGGHGHDDGGSGAA